MTFRVNAPGQTMEVYISINDNRFCIYDEEAVRFSRGFKVARIVTDRDGEEAWQIALRRHASLKEAYDQIYLMTLA